MRQVVLPVVGRQTGIADTTDPQQASRGFQAAAERFQFRYQLIGEVFHLIQFYQQTSQQLSTQ
jgi:hypothetical protein